MKKLVLALIKFYQRGGFPFIARGSCRYKPTCSNYTLQAVEKYGAVKGLLLGGQRVLRCF